MRCGTILIESPPLLRFAPVFFPFLRGYTLFGKEFLEISVLIFVAIVGTLIGEIMALAASEVFPSGRKIKFPAPAIAGRAKKAFVGLHEANAPVFDLHVTPNGHSV